jgi:hypothetical protein
LPLGRQSFIDYRVPPEKITPLAEFDGSVVVERTAGEVSARCHDEQANFLALNLMQDVVTDRRTVADARAYYAKEFLDARRGQPTPVHGEAPLLARRAKRGRSRRTHPVGRRPRAGDARG